MRVHNYENLKMWQKSMDIVESVYNLTEDFPSAETYGLTSQMRRCAISIPSNIAEGSRRKTKKDFSQFLSITFGSGAELEIQPKIAKRLGYVEKKLEEYEKIEELLSEIMKMIHKFMDNLNSTNF